MALKRPQFPFDEIEENSNLPAVFLQRAMICGERTALRYKINGEFTGAYSWRDWVTHVKRVALGLHALGIRKGDRVGILSENCPEWTFADLGTMSLGAALVPIYATSSENDIAHIIHHAELKAFFVSTSDQLQKVFPFRDQFVRDGLIGFFTESFPEVLSLTTLEDRGRLMELNYGGFYDTLVRKVRADDTATIIYTSGTTGLPKGVMLSHRNLIANYQGSFRRIQVDEGDSVVSCLPLSHVFERLAGYYYMVARGAVIAYAENMLTVGEDIAKVRPTIVIAVPRFYEKTRMKILDAVANAPRWKQGLFKWATRVGMRVSQLRIRRRKIPFGLAFFHGIAGLTVFNKIRKAMGGRIRFFVSGGAPLSKRLARFFHVLSMMVLEGYGLTETSPVLAVNALEDFKFGTVGKPIAGIGVRIAEDGEIMTSGPCVMQGYFKNPGATAGVMRDGWFYTGDIGYFDRDGFLRITDRKKDIIVTAGGKNVAPLNIEGRILSDSLFSRVMVVGDKRPYLCALLVLNRENLMRAAGVCASSEPEYAALLKRTETYEFVRRRLDACLEGLASYERIKAFELIKDEFTIAGGELTPTLKIKRRAVIEKYRDIIDALYQRTDDRWAAASSKDAGTGCP